MKNRNVEFFNLSFLDLLSGALAAIIFLFIIVPKGEMTIKDDPVTVTYDSIQNKFFGSIQDPLLMKRSGDTILAIVGNVQGIPVAVAETRQPEEEEPEPVARKPRREKTQSPPPKEEKLVTKTSVPESKLQGSRPDVPCVLSIEIKWANKQDNVDLFVCKDQACVFGGKRHRDFIGFWDSGKSKTSIFGGDLRTNQEAVRQFDQIIPGTYNILAQYKESQNPTDDLPVRLQVYTRNENKVERGKEHYFDLDLNPNEKTRIAQVTVGPDGEIDFQSFK